MGTSPLTPELAIWSEPGERKRHCVGEADLPFGRCESRLKDVCPRHVAARRLVWNLGLDDEAPALVRIEDGGKHARGIEVGETKPVDGAVARDKGDGAAVADGCVLPDRGESIDAVHVFSGDVRAGAARRGVTRAEAGDDAS